MSFKNPNLHVDKGKKVPLSVARDRYEIAKARHDHYVLQFMHLINSEVTAKREIKNLTTLRDQCRDLGLREAADCFDTALEATELGMKALVKGKD